MWALVKSGSVDTIYDRARPITIGDIKYPREIFILWTKAERKAIDVYDIVKKDQPDENFYNVSDSTFVYDADTDTVSEDFTVTEKNLAELKAEHIKSVQLASRVKIIHYDWLALRYVWDNTKAIPSAVATYTAAIRTHSSTIGTAIDGCSDLDAFKVVYAKIYDDDGEYNTGWPDDSGVKSYER